MKVSSIYVSLWVGFVAAACSSSSQPGADGARRNRRRWWRLRRRLLGDPDGRRLARGQLRQWEAGTTATGVAGTGAGGYPTGSAGVGGSTSTGGAGTTGGTGAGGSTSTGGSAEPAEPSAASSLAPHKRETSRSIRERPIRWSTASAKRTFGKAPRRPRCKRCCSIQ